MPRRFPFRLLAATPTGDHVPDTDLLGRFVRDRDPAAFELLVRRHAAAVWIACRQVCRSEPDAEDAFQAAFLVLSRKAGSVRGPCVGGWLHRVAVNAALKLRARTRQQPTHPGSLPEPATEPRPDLEEAEVAGVVQEEVSRLPERYRLPVVLCDLEGHTHAEAAAVLAWPVGSVSGRLSRARALLRNRLTQRGLAPAVGAALIVPAAGVPAGVVRAAIAAVSGSAAIPVSVSILTEGVLSAMRIAKLKLATAVVLGVVFLGIGGGAVVGLAQLPEQRPKGDEPKPKVEAPPPAPTKGEEFRAGAFPEIEAPDAQEGPAKKCPRIFGQGSVPASPSDDTYRQLLKTSLSHSTRYLSLCCPALKRGVLGSADFANYLQCLEETRGIVTELWADDRKTQISWLEEVLIMNKDAERFIQVRIKAGEATSVDLNLAIAHRFRTEAALWKAKNPKPVGR